jgi:putative tryptophan/tyrosine transport system substrate-binding protein
LSVPSGQARTPPAWIAAFQQGLVDTGNIVGRDVTVDYRFVENNELERLPEVAANLVRQGVAVIVAPGSTPAALAAKAATSAIPIVFGVASDPVQVGLVTSLNRPGGNVTGFTEINAEVWTKRLDLLRRLVPAIRRFGVLVNPKSQRRRRHQGNTGRGRCNRAPIRNLCRGRRY